MKKEKINLFSERNAFIAGAGIYIPDAVLTNKDLAKMVDTSNEWIRAMTGIGEVYIADPAKATSDVAVMAAGYCK